MIMSLHIKNFALIDDLEMTFNEGLSAMTGETGAGKSIILESLQLLFGKRSDATMIRHGESKAFVHGVFKLPKSKQELLDLPEIIDVEREIDQNGKHNMRINGEASTLSKIKEVMNTIGSIHSQNETMNLFDKSFYLTFIDQVDQKSVDQLLNQYLIDRSHYLAKKKHFETLKQKKSQSIEKQSFLEYQVKELKGYNLEPDEKDVLEDKIEKLKNHDKIMNQLRTAYQQLDNEMFQIDQVYEAGRALEKISNLDLEYKEMSERLVSAYYDLVDQVEFYISLNEGEPVKPLAKVASGGERARFMFALKSIYAKANKLSLLILDEIDIGISGKTAAKVATKMNVLSDMMQLLVITHLPQVAARANHHYGITKIKEKDRMVTRIQKLNEDERIEMIALMLSDEKLSHFAIEQAKMLLRK
jgi:DNA repair ATPase RecN